MFAGSAQRQKCQGFVRGRLGYHAALRSCRTISEGGGVFGRSPGGIGCSFKVEATGLDLSPDELEKLRLRALCKLPAQFES